MQVWAGRRLHLWAGLVVFVAVAWLQAPLAGAANSPTFRDCAFLAGIDPDFVRLSGAAVRPDGTLAVSSAQPSVMVEASESSDAFDNLGHVTLSVTVTGTGGGQRTVSGMALDHVLLTVPLSGVAIGGQYTLSWAATFDNGVHTCPGSGTPENPTPNPFVLKVLPSALLPPPPPPPASAPTLALTNLAQSHRAWRATGAGHLSARARRRHVGTVFTFDLNQPSRVTLAFRQNLRGRLRGRRCVTAAKHASGRRCTRSVPRGTLVLAGRGVGQTSVLFGGKIRGRRLPPGNYVLMVTATNVAGQTASRSIAFTIVG
jgi:hypothetical protein